MSADHARADSPAVAVILVNWNAWRDTVECLDSILAQSHSRFHIFVADNASGDDSVEQIAGWCAQPRAETAWRRHSGAGRHTDAAPAPAVGCRVAPESEQPLPAAAPGCRVSLIRCAGNRGFAAGCNAGVRAASLQAFDYFWFLNNDTVIDRDALAALLRRAQQEPRPGMVGSTVRYYDQPDIVQALGGARLDLERGGSRHLGEGQRLDQFDAGQAAAVERDMAYVFGASMLVSADFIRQVGLMQEDYFLYFEEIDWALRGRERYGLGYAADSHVFHKSGASSSKVIPVFSAGYFYRNRIRFISRFFPQRLPATRRHLVFDMLYFLSKRRWALAGVVASVWWNAPRLAAQALGESMPPG
jgi:GT2 family glycosyltransferase